MNTLLKGLQKEFNYTRTENMALTYKSTLDGVLDLFYHAPAKRGQDITSLFANAYNDNALLAIKIMFYTRDIRSGQGERELFRQMLNWMYKNDQRAFNAVAPLVPEYGRWDDLLTFTDSDLVRRQVNAQFKLDMIAEHPSLLAKWMPSENTSSVKTRALAAKWRVILGLTPRQYRTRLSLLRKRINVLERLMSAGEFGAINYSTVPSNAGLRYRKAFSTRDAERYVAYLESVKKGEAKINSATLYPYDLLKTYITSAHPWSFAREEDTTIELQWKALPNFADTDDNVLVFCDVSESMYNGMSAVRPIFISVSLAIYLAERNHGAFANNFISYTDIPRLITLRGNSLLDRVKQVFAAGVGYNTDLQAAFDLVLDTALKNKVSQEEMPKYIIIVSDMEFDSVGHGTNFETIKRKFARSGYTMPKLIFWNVSSRAEQVPVLSDEKDVYLVSGASASVFKSVVSAKAVTPFEMMLEILDSERYAQIEEALAVI
jgi:uncharacterized protein DUF2828